MKNKIILLGFSTLLTLAACKSKPTEQDTEANLAKAMTKSLNENHRADSLKAKFEILDVTYYEEQTLYRCEFKVHLKSPQKDTTGIMSADISKDFQRVIRKR